MVIDYGTDDVANSGKGNTDRAVAFVFKGFIGFVRLHGNGCGAGDDIGITNGDGRGYGDSHDLMASRGDGFGGGDGLTNGKGHSGYVELLDFSIASLSLSDYAVWCMEQRLSK